MEYSIGQVLFICVVASVIVFILPIALIWAMNTLLALGIVLTLKTHLASLFVTVLLITRVNVSVSVR